MQDTVTDPHNPPETNTTRPLAQETLRALFSCQEAAPPQNVPDDVPHLCAHLESLRSSALAIQYRAPTLERLFTRSISTVRALTPEILGSSLPLPRKTRQLVRSLQDLLKTLAEDLFAALAAMDDHLVKGVRQPHERVLWRSLYALSQHLLIGNLAASPPAGGTWQQLHQIYETALRLGVATRTLESTSHTVQSAYYTAILLGCAQPASFSSLEIDFVASYLEGLSSLPDLIDDSEATTPSTFWIDPARDTPPVARARKPPPPETPVRYFACDKLAMQLKTQLAALDAGSSPYEIDLPDFAGTPAGRGVLRRLTAYWGEPGKRRFPRRRQNYRATLCAGLDTLWQLLQKDDTSAVETSNWMVINECPDGYAVMHVSGKPGDLSIGDVIAIRTESGESWQICIIRWALSENQEHLELGLQILATHAVPAILALPESADTRHLHVLILPKIKTLRPAERVVTPSGALADYSENLVLIVENGNLEVREITSTGLDEQNSHVEVYSIVSAKRSS